MPTFFWSGMVVLLTVVMIARASTREAAVALGLSDRDAEWEGFR